MQTPGRLFLHRRHHRRVRMTEDQRAGAADIVDVPVAAHLLQARAGAAVDDEPHLLRQGVAAEPGAGERRRGQLVIRLMTHGARTGRRFVRAFYYRIRW